jgi:putative molybdopterin biosynthesis protein
MQGLVFRPGDARFEKSSIKDAVRLALDDPDCLMVNRNRGSGTRVLIDGLLAGREPRGFAVEVRSHNGVAAAVAQSRADWGVAIAPVAKAYGLAFLPIGPERFDFAVPADRWDRPAVGAFRQVLGSETARQRLRSLGFLVEPTPEGGSP